MNPSLSLILLNLPIPLFESVLRLDTFVSVQLGSVLSYEELLCCSLASSSVELGAKYDPLSLSKTVEDEGYGLETTLPKTVEDEGYGLELVSLGDKIVFRRSLFLR